MILTLSKESGRDSELIKPQPDQNISILNEKFSNTIESNFTALIQTEI